MIMSDKIYISMYHYTRDLVYSRYPNGKVLDARYFKKQLEYMKENFNIEAMEM